MNESAKAIPAAKNAAASPEKKPQKPILEILADQVRKQVLAGKVSADDLTAFQAKIGKYVAILQA